MVLASGTLVNVDLAILAGPLRRAFAGVRVDAVDALAAVDAQAAAAVVDVDLATGAMET